MSEELKWWPIALMVSVVMFCEVIIHHLDHPPAYQPDPPPAPSWQAMVGTGDQRHTITVYGRDDVELIKGAIELDRECLPGDAQLRELALDNRRLSAENKRLAALYSDDERRIAKRKERGQEIIEAVVRASVGTQDWDNNWLKHYGLSRTWRPRVSCWQNHLSEEVSFDNLCDP